MFALYLTIISLAYFIAIIIFVLVVRNNVKKEVRVRSIQFKLYNLRDRAIRLVAEDKIKKEDECFKFVYSNINSSITYIRLFTFRNLIKAASKTNGELKKKIEPLISEILDRENELRRIFIEYFDVMIDALVKSGHFLQGYIFITKYIFHFKPNNKRREYLKRVPIIKKQAETYYLKKDLDGYREKLATALQESTQKLTIA